jgi:hypothetical protein
VFFKVLFMFPGGTNSVLCPIKNNKSLLDLIC